jgi:Trypsin-like peptidase domain
MNLARNSLIMPQIPTWGIPVPYLWMFASNTPSPPDLTLLPRPIEPISDNELVEIINHRCEPQKNSLISAVFDEPDFLPIAFLELGLRRVSSICRIVRQFSGQAINVVIPKIHEVEETQFSGNFFTKEELVEIFCMSDKGEEFIQKFFQGIEEQRPSTFLTLTSFTDLLPIPIGTGFTVGKSYLLTNHHVIPDEDSAAECLAQFGYDQDILGRKLTPVEYELDPSVFFTNPGLDYTFVKIKETPKNSSLESLGKAGDRFGWLTMSTYKTMIAPPISSEEIERLRIQGFELEIKKGDNLLGEPVNIIQHPKGQRKQVALSNNRMLEIERDFIRYQADADFSSSGSAVCNQQWQLVGLHHAAIPKLDGEGKVVRKDKNSKIFVIQAQQGVRIHRIVEDLEQQVKERNEKAEQEAIKNETFNPAMQKTPPKDPVAEEVENFIKYFVDKPNEPAEEKPVYATAF